MYVWLGITVATFAWLLKPDTLGELSTWQLVAGVSIALGAIAIHRGAWKGGEATAQKWRATLQQHVHAHLGDKGVDRVTTDDVMAALAHVVGNRTDL